MARRETDVRVRQWSDPSLIFTDTQRVDLFDDPRWDTSPPPVRTAAGSSPSRRRTAGRLLPFPRPRRGRHSRRRRR